MVCLAFVAVALPKLTGSDHATISAKQSRSMKTMVYHFKVWDPPPIKCSYPGSRALLIASKISAVV